jgi:hypothetical protein
MSKKLISRKKVTFGLSLLTYEDGTKEYLSVEYSFKYPDFVANVKSDIVERKSGVTGMYLTPGKFLRSKKRDNPGIKIVSWQRDPIPIEWSEDLATKYQLQKDRLFIEYMDLYQASKLDRSLGDELYHSHISEDLDEIIKNSWIKARQEAKLIVFGNKAELATGQGKSGMSYRKGQEPAVIALYNDIMQNSFTEGELPPGVGKTALFYFLSLLLKGRVNLYVTDTIKNTTELLWKMYNYSLMDNKVLSNPIVVNSERKNNQNILKTGARLLPLYDGNNKGLVRALKEIANSNENYNIFTTYHSVGGLLKLISKEKDFPLMDLFRDEIQMNAERSYGHEFNSILSYKKLFGRGVGLSGSCIRRPKSSTDKSIIYNGDSFHWGKLSYVMTESEARSLGLICEQKMLIIPIPDGQDDLKTAIVNRQRVRIFLGISKVTGKRVSTDQKAAMILVQRGIQEAIKLGKHHIHIPCSRRSTARAITKFILKMQECDLISSRYKVFTAMREDGDKLLKQWNDQEFAIVTGTKWMNQGTDTVKCDCQVFTYVPGSEWGAIQLKGRENRTHESKDYALMIICEFESSFKDNPLYKIAERELGGGGYSVVGADPETRQIIVNEDNLEEDIDTSTPNFDSTEDALDNSDLAIMQSGGSDPELFVNFVKLGKKIASKEYTDDEGNSLFSEIFKNLHSISDEELINRVKKYSIKRNFSKENPSSYSLIIQRGLDYDKVYSHCLDYQYRKAAENKDKEFFINLLLPYKGKGIKDIQEGILPLYYDHTNIARFGGKWVYNTAYEIGIDLDKLLGRVNKVDGFTFEQIMKVAKKCKSLSEINRDLNVNLARWCKNNKVDIQIFKDALDIPTEAEIIEVFKQYNSMTSLKCKPLNERHKWVNRFINRKNNFKYYFNLSKAFCWGMESWTAHRNLNNKQI